MSNDDGTVDREAILARRLFLISSALAAVSCAPRAPTASQGRPDVAVAGSPRAAASTSASAREGTAPPPDPLVESLGPPVYETWEKVVAAAPPRNVSRRLPKDEQEALHRLNRWFDETSGAIHELWNTDPGCDPRRPECEEAWVAVAKKWERVQDDLDDLAGCGGLSSNPPLWSRRARLRKDHFFGLLQEVRARLIRNARSYGPGREQALHLLAPSWWPTGIGYYPCLDCAPRPPAVPQEVAFSDGSDLLDLSNERVLFALEQIRNTVAEVPPRAQGTLRVRGHADPKETHADALALARARAVASWLAEHGIDPKRLEVLSLGSEAPITRSDAEVDAAVNRRVEVEVVLKPEPR